MLFAKPLASFVLLHGPVPLERVHVTPSLWVVFICSRIQSFKGVNPKESGSGLGFLGQPLKKRWQPLRKRKLQNCRRLIGVMG